VSRRNKKWNAGLLGLSRLRRQPAVRKPTHVDVQTLAFEVAEINSGAAAISKLSQITDG
jgi:hypothetical protein